MIPTEAVAIQPQSSRGEVSARRCPACDQAPALRHRSLGERSLALEECQTCAGLWLPLATFEQLLREARTVAAGAEAQRVAAPPVASGGASATRYRSCPNCRALMHRQNFGRRSGVIVDRCRDCGVWFDAHELDAVLRWVRAGGEKLASAREADEVRERERVRRAGAVLPPAGGSNNHSSWDGSVAGELVEALIRWLVR